VTSHPYFCPSKKISTYQIAFFLRGYDDNEICTIIFRVYEIAHRFGGASEKNVSPLLQNYQSCVSPLQTFATHV
jgi:hypothetical protein